MVGLFAAWVLAFGFIGWRVLLVEPAAKREAAGRATKADSAPAEELRPTEAASVPDPTSTELVMLRGLAERQGARIAELEKAITDYATKLDDRDREIGRLMGQITSLREAAQRSPETPRGPGDVSQFHRLRALIIKELHPDHAPPGSVDRALRAEVFKAMWPRIEAIAGRA